MNEQVTIEDIEKIFINKEYHKVKIINRNFENYRIKQNDLIKIDEVINLVILDNIVECHNKDKNSAHIDDVITLKKHIKKLYGKEKAPFRKAVNFAFYVIIMYILMIITILTLLFAASSNICN